MHAVSQLVLTCVWHLTQASWQTGTELDMCKPWCAKKTHPRIWAATLCMSAEVAADKRCAPGWPVMVCLSCCIAAWLAWLAADGLDGPN